MPRSGWGDLIILRTALTRVDHTSRVLRQLDRPIHISALPTKKALEDHLAYRPSSPCLHLGMTDQKDTRRPPCMPTSITLSTPWLLSSKVTLHGNFNHSINTLVTELKGLRMVNRGHNSPHSSSLTSYAHAELNAFWPSSWPPAMNTLPSTAPAMKKDCFEDVSFVAFVVFSVCYW
ncbi:hypothetical protein NE237_015820 [Protea cynaroides]|uniref:Uncharacterized protein n=1 Tax=Protea cynaroides TaxID=273540 RepID=A0A9Q0QRK5_9MAGN|nr:hypothetical protein NE237_015820 [Protea cynaroides]